MEFRTYFNAVETAFATVATREGEVEDRLGAVRCEDESLTKQEFKEECDINHIMARYQKFGVLPASDGRTPMYGDFASVGDLLESQQIVQQAEADFAALPSSIRDRFSNSAVKFAEFLMDESNREEAVKLGLVNAPPKEEPPKIEEVPPKREPNILRNKVEKKNK